MDRWLERRAAWILIVVTSWAFGAIALGFVTLAGYRALLGGFSAPEAALIVAAAYAAGAALVAAVAVACRKRLREETGAAPGNAIQTEGLAAVIDTLTGNGAPSSAPALAGLAQLSKSLSPIQLAGLALVGGFVVGRKLPV
jgi:hypothetical protein